MRSPGESPAAPAAPLRPMSGALKAAGPMSVLSVQRSCPGPCGGQPGEGRPSRHSVSLFEAYYLTVERSKIYVGRSRHWAVVWLWFLS